MTRYIILLLLLGAAACSTARFIPGSTAHTLPPYHGEVTLLHQFPATEYTGLGIVTVSSHNTLLSNETLILQLQAEAAKQGANAIVMPEADASTDYVEKLFKGLSLAYLSPKTHTIKAYAIVIPLSE